MSKQLKLGFMIGYWGAGPPLNAPELLAEAERLGYDSAWTAEAYGSDALTPLAWWGSQTSRIQLGTSIAQIAARTPTAMAMAAITMDHLTQGRFILGLGASGPQVVEGWYGQPYPKPLARTREYVEIIRKVLARDEPVSYAGEHYTLPYPGGAGLGKPVKSITHPYRKDLPIYLAAEGPKNVALSAEIADGWLAIYFSPRVDGFYRDALAEGFARPGAVRTAEDFEVAATVPVIIHDDVEEAAGLPAAGARAVHRRHGCPRGELPRQRVRPDGLRGRGPRDPGPVPPGQEGGSRGARPDVADRGDRAHRAEGEDPRRPRGVARVLRHHDAPLRRRQHAPHHGRARPLTPPTSTPGWGWGQRWSKMTSSASVRIQVRLLGVEEVLLVGADDVAAVGVRRHAEERPGRREPLARHAFERHVGARVVLGRAGGSARSG